MACLCVVGQAAAVNSPSVSNAPRQIRHGVIHIHKRARARSLPVPNGLATTGAALPVLHTTNSSTHAFRFLYRFRLVWFGFFLVCTFAIRCTCHARLGNTPNARAVESGDRGDYIGTGLEVYMQSEPCLMCSMALVHGALFCPHLAPPAAYACSFCGCW
jgi:hypothetical protein